MPTLRIGTRGSALALWQANHVRQMLERTGASIEMEVIRTSGDKITDVPLAQVGGKGLFTKEIEEALLAGRIDLAVHSLKDLPTQLPPGLLLAAVTRREDPRDALVARNARRFADLPRGARVGTSSLRRQVQLKHLRPDLVIEPLRGNLDTRLRKLDTGQYDAIVVAAAGLKRLGWEQRATQFFEPDEIVPAIGQGALGIETRADDLPLHSLLRAVHDPETATATAAERAFLKHLGGGCQVPLGAHARVATNELHLVGLVASQDGGAVVRGSLKGAATEAEVLGTRLAGKLLAEGAAEILATIHAAPAGLQPPGAA
ncbi:MAG: hydroxymethylbilane synthase [Acidobacteria bacterium]|nr:hydroxymethylbilane synthase [Acidobacteriota bacterium]